MMKRLLISLLAVVACCTGMKAQKIALQTDVVWDALMTPNLGAEIVTGERSTVGLALMGNYKPWGKDIRLFVAQPEWRYYFSGRPMSKFFFGVGGLVGFYDITTHGKTYDGLTYGAGLTFGYVIKLGSRLNIDAHAGVGAVAYSRKEYYKGDAYDRDYIKNGEIKSNAKGYNLIPTKIGVSISYILW